MMTLKETRIRAVLSQRDLAKQADVALRTIVEAEAGRNEPRAATMRRVAQALGVAVTDIAEFRTTIEDAVAGKAAA